MCLSLTQSQAGKSLAAGRAFRVSAAVTHPMHNSPPRIRPRGGQTLGSNTFTGRLPHYLLQHIECPRRDVTVSGKFSLISRGTAWPLPEASPQNSENTCGSWPGGHSHLARSPGGWGGGYSCPPVPSPQIGPAPSIGLAPGVRVCLPQPLGAGWAGGVGGLPQFLLSDLTQGHSPTRSTDEPQPRVVLPWANSAASSALLSAPCG